MVHEMVRIRYFTNVLDEMRIPSSGANLGMDVSCC